MCTNQNLYRKIKQSSLGHRDKNEPLNTSQKWTSQLGDTAFSIKSE